MADSRAILDTSNALLALIKSAAETPGTPGTLNVPKGHMSIESIDLLKDEIAKPHVTIFLFNIHENPLLKNQPRLVSPPKPRPGAVAIASETNLFAAATASPKVNPLANPAVMAAEYVQPAPWVCRV